MSLQAKSLTELRGIAQAMGVGFTFADDKIMLAQKIEAKQIKEVPPVVPPAYPMADMAVLRTNRPPAKVTDPDSIVTMLQPYIQRGLQFTVDGDTWRMTFAGKEDTGTLRMPPRNVLQCADKLMKPSKGSRYVD